MNIVWVPLLIGLTAAQSDVSCHEEGVEYQPDFALDSRWNGFVNASDCQLWCQNHSTCKAWTFVKNGLLDWSDSGGCLLKSSTIPSITVNSGNGDILTSGKKFCTDSPDLACAADDDCCGTGPALCAGIGNDNRSFYFDPTCRSPADQGWLAGCGEHPREEYKCCRECGSSVHPQCHDSDDICYEGNFKLTGEVLATSLLAGVPSRAYCHESCRNTEGCSHWMYVENPTSVDTFGGACYHKDIGDGVVAVVEDIIIVSGPKECPVTPIIECREDATVVLEIANGNEGTFDPVRVAAVSMPPGDVAGLPELKCGNDQASMCAVTCPPDGEATEKLEMFFSFYTYDRRGVVTRGPVNRRACPFTLECKFQSTTSSPSTAAPTPTTKPGGPTTSTKEVDPTETSQTTDGTAATSTSAPSGGLPGLTCKKDVVDLSDKYGNSQVVISDVLNVDESATAATFEPQGDSEMCDLEVCRMGGCPDSVTEDAKLYPDKVTFLATLNETSAEMECPFSVDCGAAIPMFKCASDIVIKAWEGTETLINHQSLLEAEWSPDVMELKCIPPEEGPWGQAGNDCVFTCPIGNGTDEHFSSVRVTGSNGNMAKSDDCVLKIECGPMCFERGLKYQSEVIESIPDVDLDACLGECKATPSCKAAQYRPPRCILKQQLLSGEEAPIFEMDGVTQEECDDWCIRDPECNAGGDFNKSMCLLQDDNSVKIHTNDWLNVFSAPGSECSDGSLQPYTPFNHSKMSISYTAQELWQPPMLKMDEATQCPVGYRKLGDKCYRVSKDRKSFQEAERACFDEGSWLAQPRTTDDNANLLSLFCDGPKCAVARGQAFDGTYFIGLRRHYRDNAEVWSWRDRSTMIWANWGGKDGVPEIDIPGEEGDQSRTREWGDCAYFYPLGVTGSAHGAWGKTGCEVTCVNPPGDLLNKAMSPFCGEDFEGGRFAPIQRRYICERNIGSSTRGGQLRNLSPRHIPKSRKLPEETCVNWGYDLGNDDIEKGTFALDFNGCKQYCAERGCAYTWVQATCFINKEEADKSWPAAEVHSIGVRNFDDCSRACAGDPDCNRAPRFLPATCYTKKLEDGEQKWIRSHTNLDIASGPAPCPGKSSHVVPDEPSCPYGYSLITDPDNLANNRCFRVSFDRLTTAEASSECALEGGHLAMPKTKELNFMLMKMFCTDPLAGGSGDCFVPRGYTMLDGTYLMGLYSNQVGWPEKWPGEWIWADKDPPVWEYYGGLGSGPPLMYGSQPTYQPDNTSGEQYCGYFYPRDHWSNDKNGAWGDEDCDTKCLAPAGSNLVAIGSPECVGVDEKSTGRRVRARRRYICEAFPSQTRRRLTDTLTCVWENEQFVEPSTGPILEFSFQDTAASFEYCKAQCALERNCESFTLSKSKEECNIGWVTTCSGDSVECQLFGAPPSRLGRVANNKALSGGAPPCA